MSKKIQGITVALEFPIHEDNIDTVINAIKMIKYVSDVKPIEMTPDDFFAKSQLKHDLIMKFYKFIDEELKQH